MPSFFRAHPKKCLFVATLNCVAFIYFLASSNPTAVSAFENVEDACIEDAFEFDFDIERCEVHVERLIEAMSLGGFVLNPLEMSPRHKHQLIASTTKSKLLFPYH